jgi:hypothetical protein
VSVNKPASLKALIESKVEMNKPCLKEDFLTFAYLEREAILCDEHCHVVDHKKMDDFGTKNMGKNSDVGGRKSERNPGGLSSSRGGCNKTSDQGRRRSGT